MIIEIEQTIQFYITGIRIGLNKESISGSLKDNILKQKLSRYYLV